MTPEQWAAQFFQSGVRYWEGQSSRVDSEIEAEIARIVREAVAAERERCALMCEDRAAGVQCAIDEGGATPALAEMVAQLSDMAEVIRRK